MKTTRIAYLNEMPGFHAREDRGEYDNGVDDAAADPLQHLYEAQGKVGDALNLAGLLLKSLEDEGDARAMQIHAAVSVIEEKLADAFRQIGEHEARDLARSLERADPDNGE
jgi:hypothetical protein